MFKKIMILILKIVIVLISILILFAGFTLFQNNQVVTSEYGIYSKKLNPVYDNTSIAVIADFHSSDNFNKIIKSTNNMSPIAIFIVGDLVNSNQTDFTNADKLLEGLVQIAPTYFVSGNNEVWSTNEADILKFIESKGVIVANNKVLPLTYINNTINIIGFKDIIYSDQAMRMTVLDKQIKDLYNKIGDTSLFNLLLFHRGQYFDEISKYPFDLVLSGHLHGGQINVPFLNEYILQNQFNNTKYIKGYYRIGSSQMVISGGLEKNYSTPRVFNPPEVTQVKLHSIK